MVSTLKPTTPHHFSVKLQNAVLFTLELLIEIRDNNTVVWEMLDDLQLLFVVIRSFCILATIE